MVSRAAMHAACELEELDMSQDDEATEWTHAYKARVAEIVQRALDWDAEIAQTRNNSAAKRRERKAQWEAQQPQTEPKQVANAA